MLIWDHVPLLFTGSVDAVSRLLGVFNDFLYGEPLLVTSVVYFYIDLSDVSTNCIMSLCCSCPGYTYWPVIHGGLQVRLGNWVLSLLKSNIIADCLSSYVLASGRSICSPSTNLKCVYERNLNF